MPNGRWGVGRLPYLDKHGARTSGPLLPVTLDVGAESPDTGGMPTTSVPHDIFQHAIADARYASLTIRDATSPSEEYPRFGATYYLTRDSLSGYGVTADGTLIGLFSLVRGRGASLMAAALADGARKLDCFDGFLPGFYGRFGFVETRREPNWLQATKGDYSAPDVVFMHLGQTTHSEYVDSDR